MNTETVALKNHHKYYGHLVTKCGLKMTTGASLEVKRWKGSNFLGFLVKSFSMFRVVSFEIDLLKQPCFNRAFVLIKL